MNTALRRALVPAFSHDPEATAGRQLTLDRRG
jgi:hypothetical protein